MMQDEIKENKIYLTKEEAKSFVLIKKYIEKFMTLINAGAFDLDYGKVEINCYNNEIRDVHIHKITYQRFKNGSIIKRSTQDNNNQTKL